MFRPFVQLKLATSLDGRIATAAGESRWITGEEARAVVQRLRNKTDAIMIGAGTMRADDPELLTRTDPQRLRPPVRVVLDSALSLPLSARLIATIEKAPVMLIGAEGADAARQAALQAVGVKVALLPAGRGGVDIKAALDLLVKEGVRGMLVEGGGELAASLIAANAVDRIEWFRAPIVLGAEGRPSVAALALAHLADAPRFARVALRELGPDIWESYERVS